MAGAGLRELLGRMGRWRVGLRWYLIAVAVPLAFAVGAAIAAAGQGWPHLIDLGCFRGLPEVDILGVWVLAVLERLR